MKRLTALLMVSVLALGACGAGDAATAATVDDQTITVSEVNGLLDIEEGAITKAQFAQVLSILIESAVVEKAAADDFDISVTPEETSAEADRIYEEFSEEGQSREEFVAARGFTEDFLQMVGQQEVIYRKIHEAFADEGRGVPTDDEVAEQMDSQRIRLTEACVSHILLGELQGLEGDELEDAKADALAEAEEVLDLLDDGGEFAELARERSTDTGSGAQGGELGCSSPAQWVEPFQEAVMDAPIGEVLDEPVLSEFGYHVIFVRTRTIPNDDEVVEAITTDGVSREIDAWVREKLAATEVSVVERFGTWDTTALRVIPPTA